MIKGLGSDIIEISRVEASLLRTDNRLAKRILTPEELERFNQCPQPHRYFAKRFAAKEAAAKALGTGIGQGVSWQDICIRNNDLGAPQLYFSGGALLHCEALGVETCHLSITDEKHYAMAVVVLEGQ
ncbi:MAG: holo-ACP synthase [Pseudomonadales bacterium]